MCVCVCNGIQTTIRLFLTKHFHIQTSVTTFSSEENKFNNLLNERRERHFLGVADRETEGAQPTRCDQQSSMTVARSAGRLLYLPPRSPRSRRLIRWVVSNIFQVFYFHGWCAPYCHRNRDVITRVVFAYCLRGSTSTQRRVYRKHAGRQLVHGPERDLPPLYPLSHKPTI